MLILTTVDLDEYVYAALTAGASGFLVKDASAAELLTGIRVVAAGDALLAPRVTRRLIASFTRQDRRASRASPRLEVITGREREVLTLIATGLSNTEIAQHLHVTIGTVKTHIGRLLSKLAARDRAQLVIAAYETGLVTPEPRSRSAARCRPGGKRLDKFNSAARNDGSARASPKRCWDFAVGPICQHGGSTSSPPPAQLT